MTKFSGFTYQASAEARSAAKRGWDSSAESTPSLLRPAPTPPTPPTPLGPAHRTPDQAPLARKAACATATSTAEALADSPALTLGPLRLWISDYCVPMAPAVGLLSPDPEGESATTSVCRVGHWSGTGSCPVCYSGLPFSAGASHIDPPPPLCRGLARRPPPPYELLSIDTDVAVSASLGAAASVPPAARFAYRGPV